MSEKTYTHHSHEYEKQGEIDVSREKLDALFEKGEHAKREHEESKAEKLDELRAETKAEAVSSAETISLQSENDQRVNQASPLVNKDLKDLKYKRTLQSIRKDLSKPERTLSKVVHNKTVDAISSVADKTVARPSGLLVGGVCAFLGSSIFLWICKHYGYTYNFLLFTIFFVGGFALGLLIELAVRAMYRPAKR